MGRLVMKFGGTSVANIDRIRDVARHVKREVDAGHDVAVVVSAMSGKTNELISWCSDASPMHDAREYDAVVASGEQVTSGLLAIALQGMGIQARSWQGWQIPIKTSDAHASARILDIDGSELVQRPDDNEATVRARMKEQIPPLLEVVDHYRRAGVLQTVDGREPISAVSERLLRALETTPERVE